MRNLSFKIQTRVARHILPSLSLSFISNCWVFFFETFLSRLLSKRPLSFVGACDGYTLREGGCGAGDWEGVASEPERLQQYMSYDEIKLAALLQVASPVAPINA